MFYTVRTWDMDEQRYSSQIGVRDRHLTLADVRRAIRRLRDMGYIASRLPRPHGDDPFVSIDEDTYPLMLLEEAAGTADKPNHGRKERQ